MDYDKASMEMHRKHKGKLEISSKVSLESREDLSVAYTPGVAAPCREIATKPDEVYLVDMKEEVVDTISIDDSGIIAVDAGAFKIITLRCKYS